MEGAELELTTLREQNRRLSIRLIEYKKQVQTHDAALQCALKE